jgi:hypothetical protein
LSAWLYHTRLLHNSYMGVHHSSFHFKNSTESFISMLLKLKQLKLVYHFLSLGSHICFDSLKTHRVLSDYNTMEMLNQYQSSKRATPKKLFLSLEYTISTWVIIPFSRHAG